MIRISDGRMSGSALVQSYYMLAQCASFGPFAIIETGDFASYP